VPISIVLADDHAVVRRGMRALFESEPDFSVVGMASDGLETVRLTEQLKPDVAVVDLMMPALGGLEALRILRDRAPRTRCVILSIYNTGPFIAQALQSGATAYVLKGCGEDLLVRAVREASAGRRYLSPPVSETAIRAYATNAAKGFFSPHETLTPRQREVLQLAAEGHTSAEIGGRLHISPRTVENHRATLMQRLGLTSQTELIRHAIRHGLIPSDQ
jgi:two-component system, NarL family, response regulator NreC